MYENEREYFLILDLVSGGEMFEHLIKNGAYSEQDAALHIKHVASSLNFLHGINLVHADLKPENLMMTSWTEVRSGEEQRGAKGERRELDHRTQ